MEHLTLSKWYTRLVGVFFILVSVSLVSDLISYGVHPETMHKIFHITLGLIVVTWGWHNISWWSAFPLTNGIFFSFVGLFGWLFPDFGGLDAFNRVDTILHSVVGLSGLMIGFARLYRGVGPIASHE